MTPTLEQRKAAFETMPPKLKRRGIHQWYFENFETIRIALQKSAQVDGLMKALNNSQEQFGLIYESLKGETTDDKTAMAYAFAEAGQEITYDALQQFSAKEI